MQTGQKLSLSNCTHNYVLGVDGAEERLERLEAGGGEKGAGGGENGAGREETARGNVLFKISSNVRSLFKPRTPTLHTCLPRGYCVSRVARTVTCGG